MSKGTQPALARADHLARIGRVDEAVSTLMAALVSNPDDAEVHLALARAELRPKHYSVALDHAKRAILLEPDSPHAEQVMAYALLGLGQTSHSLQVSRHALSLAPNDSTCLLNHARLSRLAAQTSTLRKRQWLVEAANTSHLSIETDPMSTDALYEGALIALDRARPLEASALATRVLGINPVHSGAHLVLGRTLARAGKTDLSSEHLVESGRLNPADDRPTQELDRLRFPRWTLYLLFGGVPIASALACWATAMVGLNDQAEAQLQLGLIAAVTVTAVVAVCLGARAQRRRLTPASLGVITGHRQSTHTLRKHKFRRNAVLPAAAVSAYLVVNTLLHRVTSSPAQEKQWGQFVFGFTVLGYLVAAAITAGRHAQRDRAECKGRGRR